MIYEYGDFYLTSLWERKKNGEMVERPYGSDSLGTFCLDGVLVKWDVRKPMKVWPGVNDEVELCVLFFARDEVLKVRKKLGMETQKKIMPLLKLPLPETETEISRIAANIYQTSKLALPLYKYKTQMAPLPNKVTFEEYQDYVEKKIVGLNPMEEVWQSVGSKVTIQLLDPSGHPVVGAQVGHDVSNNDGKLKWYDQDENRNCLLSDEKGKVVFEGSQLFRKTAIRREKSSIYAVHEDRQLVAISQVIDEHFGKTIQVIMKPACRVKGRYVCPKSDSGKDGFKSVYTRFSMTGKMDTKMMTSLMFTPITQTTSTYQLDVLLVPGKYTINCDSYDKVTKKRASGGKHVDVPEKPELDLGVIELKLRE
ncbi:MAG: hypothetical protein K9M57_04150 [Phycisphaerae bacterium]|nr:hypothetical protein [Phycisphaerae bacterium]